MMREVVKQATQFTGSERWQDLSEGQLNMLCVVP